MSEKLPKACTADLQYGCEQLNLSLSVEQHQALLDYLDLLYRWNKAYNLTAIREPREMLHKHILDALAIVPHINGKRLLDVGSGGGIPGIILAIVSPECDYVLLDSNGKKTRFLTQVKMELGLTHVQVQQNRAENYYPDRLFDRIVSRAFTALDNMLYLCQHLLLDKGEFWAMKGDYPEPNQKPIPEPWIIKQTVPLSVPFVDARRHLVVIGRSEEQTWPE